MSAQDEQIDRMLSKLQRQLEISIQALEGAQAEMKAAVLAERERCANAAKSYLMETPEGDVSPRDLFELVQSGAKDYAAYRLGLN